MQVAEGKILRSVEPFGRQLYALTWDDGSATLVRVTFSPFFDEERGNKRTIRYSVATLWDSPPASRGQVPKQVFLRGEEEGTRTRIELLAENRVRVSQAVLSESLFA